MLRIEDTDIERSEKRFEKDIFEGLRWLCLDADESPEKGGPYELYRQSERTQDYANAIKKLLDESKAFYCFHTEEELEKEKDELMAAKKPVLHMCEYRTLDIKEAKLLTQAKADFIIRFKTPLGKTILFNDIIRGDLTFESDLIGDFSIAKRVDVPLYNLAVVVDDEAMKISHVIRGEDHIANTPKQLLLIEGLGYELPIYAHLPLVLGKDRSKLSKRDGATSVIEYREMGYLPEAMINFMALLGWNPGTDQEILSHKELINQFSLEKVQRSGAVFDLAKLDWMNGEYIRHASVKELTELCMPYLAVSGFVQGQSIEMIERVVALEQPRLKKLSEITEKIDYFFKMPEYDKELLAWKSMTNEDVRASLNVSIGLLGENRDKNIQEIERIFLEKAAAMGDRGSLLWPLRMALTGKKHSPGPFEILSILGIDEAIKRLVAAKNK